MPMLELEELKQRLTGLEPQLRDLRQALDIDHLEVESQELDQRTAEPGFWDNAEASQKVLQRSGAVKGKLESYRRLTSKYEDTLTLVELGLGEKDDSVYEEALQDTDDLEKAMEEMRLSTLLTGEYDARNAILTFHAGAGGTEAQDWAQMLYRMYTRWAERHGFRYKILDYLDGDEAGLKSASILVEGENAYGFLKSEMGVHRLVRISPFDASGRRHTSFASVEVLPELPEDNSVQINPEDIKMEVFRSSGAGGQHINKTSSAVRLIHKPTGIVTSCQTQRSQLQNREYAMEMLKAKLYQIALQQHKDKIDDIKGVQNEIAWGHQIRSYVFMPYTLVKDHRTNYENGNVQAVMDGDLDGFIYAYLKASSRGELQDV